MAGMLTKASSRATAASQSSAFCYRGTAVYLSCVSLPLYGRIDHHANGSFSAYQFLFLLCPVICPMAEFCSLIKIKM
jgi:hypothetical protein